MTFNQTLWLEYYQHLIEQAAPFPPKLPGVGQLPAAFPELRMFTLDATVVLTGYDPNEKRVQWIREPHASARQGAQV